MKVKPSLFMYSVVAAAAAGGCALIAMNVNASSPPGAAGDAKPALTVSLEQPGVVPMVTRLPANGSVAAWQEASIGSESHGLRLAAVHVNVGDAVARGQVLATFAPEGVQAELGEINARVAESQAQAAEAAANAERARALAASGALSAQQITQYTTAEQTAQARLEAQRAAAKVQQLRLAKTQVLAPDHGVISARLATAGAVVPSGQELFRMIRMNRLEWRAEVTAEESVKLANGTAVTVHAADGSLVQGRVRMVAPTVDSRSRTALVYVDLPASRALKAGMFVGGEFELGQSNALTVPQQALVVRDGFNYVFTVNGNRAMQLKVRTGRRVGDRVEVLGGLAAGAPVVASGAGFLNDSDLVKVVKQ